MADSKDAGTLFPKMAIGVMGSAGGELGEGVRTAVHDLGVAIGERGHVLITGVAPGLPHDAVRGAKSAGGLVVGISPALNLTEHVVKYRSPTRGYDAIIYTGSGLMGREVENIRSCDVVVFAGGRSGSLGEFAIAFDEGRVIGVLEGTGGISAHLGEIIEMLDKDTGSIVCYDTDPVRLLDKLEGVYQEHVLPKHLEALEGHDPDGVLEA